MWNETYRKEMDAVLPDPAFLNGLQDAMVRKTRAPRLLRRTVAAVLAAAVLVCAMGAGVLVWTQNRIRLFDSLQEASSAAQQEAEKNGAEAAAAGTLSSVIGDYCLGDPIRMEERMARYDDIVRHEYGKEGDPWTEMYTAHKGLFRISDYCGPTLSGLSTLWPENLPRLSFDYLEREYTLIPGYQGAWFHEGWEHGENPQAWFYGSCERGETRFDLTLVLIPGSSWNDTFLTAPGRTLEEYTTADGALVSILWAESVSGAPVFQASFTAGPCSLSLDGTHMEQNDLHQLLDSFGLGRYVA